MSGIRRTQQVTCPHCGIDGVLELGMALLNHRTQHREFDCINCGESLPMEAPREIINLRWLPGGAAAAKPQQPSV